jgi:hypothetical protein
MSQGDLRPLRPCQEIAKQVSEEYDHNRSAELVQQLIHALDAESRKRMERLTPESKAEGAA